MNIQCPQCGFSGRVPNYVAAVPHHARCPKCQFRFDIGDLAVQIPDSIDGAARHELRHDLTRPRLDPSSSSYEIEALTEDFSSDDEADRAGQDWDDDWDGAIEPDDTGSKPLARPLALPRFLRSGDGSAPDPTTGRERGAASNATPWHFRLFHVWAIVFIAWAALIGSRAVLATILRDDDFLFSKATIWPVASVVLLVAASAGLFLLMDLSRRFASAPGAAPSPSANGSTVHHGAIDQIIVKPGKLPTG
jgi:hypothetical protein